MVLEVSAKNCLWADVRDVKLSGLVVLDNLISVRGAITLAFYMHFHCVNEIWGIPTNDDSRNTNCG